MSNIQIPNFPERWVVSLEDFSESELQKANEFRQTWCKDFMNSGLRSHHYLLNFHSDRSGYYTSDLGGLIKEPFYKVGHVATLTKKEFFALLNKSKTNIMDTNKQISIGREMLNRYYEAATESQREFIDENFKPSGATTVGAIQGLHNIACDTWKAKIKQNHPECFEDDKYFDFSNVAINFRNDDNVWGKLIRMGLSPSCGEIRGSGTYEHKGIYLGCKHNEPNIKWEIVLDEEHNYVAVPTKTK